LTEHNRQIDITYVNQFVENVNWNSNKNRYYKKKKARKQYSVSWTYVPNSREKTVDQKHGRDTLRDIGKNPRVMNLKFLNIDSNGSNSYTEISHDVVVSSYSEKLIRRDVSDDTYYWDCNLSFEEV
jgi:superoxide dismutase